MQLKHNLQSWVTKSSQDSRVLSNQVSTTWSTVTYLPAFVILLSWEIISKWADGFWERRQVHAHHHLQIHNSEFSRRPIQEPLLLILHAMLNSVLFATVSGSTTSSLWSSPRFEGYNGWNQDAGLIWFNSRWKSSPKSTSSYFHTYLYISIA